jgi:hypothetical protein
MRVSAHYPCVNYGYSLHEGAPYVPQRLSKLGIFDPSYRWHVDMQLTTCESLRRTGNWPVAHTIRICVIGCMSKYSRRLPIRPLESTL